MKVIKGEIIKQMAKWRKWSMKLGLAMQSIDGNVASALSIYAVCFSRLARPNKSYSAQRSK